MSDRPPPRDIRERSGAQVRLRKAGHPGLMSGNESEDLSHSWERMWPGQDPKAEDLKYAVPHRWVRFHSLPGSKRYADDPSEEAEILRRHNIVISELLDLDDDPMPHVLVITSLYETDPCEVTHSEFFR